MGISCSRRRVFLFALLLLVVAFLPAVKIVSPLLPRKIDLEPEVRRAEFADVPRLASRNRNKVLLLAVDGTSWNVLDPLLESGELPNIAALIGRGTHGGLKSLEVMKSPVIWTTMLTGCMPEKHGIIDFLIEGKPPRSYQRRTPALWNMIGEAKSSASIGFWATWPPEPVNGFMISDYVGMRSEEDTTEEFRRMAESLTHPPGLMG
ncbi:MAG: alkaline phosphatase family protein, partial [Candidatus Aureabacteria bacterium]|nr:alkaline phosphatase family protein [Candidatus Auribacterota bacterium]